ncbi:MAG: hypothetical protein GY811_25875 [Myxococcales bacterium]|nr:hypothetical protein [Myxococcales bacterium]
MASIIDTVGAWLEGGNSAQMGFEHALREPLGSAADADFEIVESRGVDVVAQAAAASLKVGAALCHDLAVLARHVG